MNTAQYCEQLGLETVCDASPRDICGCYIGDLLSWVMGRAQQGCAWITVMSNANVAAVASMTDAACVVLCEGATADEELLQRAQKLGLPIFRSEKTAYELAVQTSALLG